MHHLVRKICQIALALVMAVIVLDTYARGVEPYVTWMGVATKEEAAQRVLSEMQATLVGFEADTLGVSDDGIKTSTYAFINGKPTSYTVKCHSDMWPQWKGQLLNCGSISALLKCPAGMVLGGLPNHWQFVPNVTQQCYPRDEDSYKEPLLQCVPGAVNKGNPIAVGNGIKVQTDTDYQGSDANDLNFTRTYRSDRNTWAHNYQYSSFDYAAPQTADSSNAPCYQGTNDDTGKSSCFRYMPTGQVNDISVQRGNGRALTFGTATNLNSAADINDVVTNLIDSSGNKNGWQVYNAEDESIERYDLSGRIQKIIARNGRTQTFTYSDVLTPVSVAPKVGLLIAVTDAFGRQLKFSYDGQGRLASMIDPANGITQYAYDEVSSIVFPGKALSNNLTSVTYPDGKKRIYWYNEQDKTKQTNLPNALTGITDENGVRFAIFNYDTNGKAISTEHVGGVEKYVVNNPNPGSNQPEQKRTVIDPLGALRTYNFQTILGVFKSTGVSQPGGTGCSDAASNISYDDNGNVASNTDFNGVKTTYRYDLTRNLETARVEAFGTAQARTISTQWHATYRLPLKIAESKRVTTFIYDTLGNQLSRTEQATTDVDGSQGFSAAVTGTSRIWSYTYNALGQILTSTGPRAGGMDKTTYTYDTSGNLSTITNPMGHVITLSNYDANGRVGSIVDANGDITSPTYSPRGWITRQSITSGDNVETTGYDYDGAGQLIKTTLPETSTITYTYDPAHRLTNVADSLGNNITYTLDNMGNRVREESKDPGGALAQKITRAYDVLNRLQQSTREGAVVAPNPTRHAPTPTPPPKPEPTPDPGPGSDDLTGPMPNVPRNYSGDPDIQKFAPQLLEAAYRARIIVLVDNGEGTLVWTWTQVGEDWYSDLLSNHVVMQVGKEYQLKGDIHNRKQPPA